MSIIMGCGCCSSPVVRFWSKSCFSKPGPGCTGENLLSPSRQSLTPSVSEVFLASPAAAAICARGSSSVRQLWPVAVGRTRVASAQAIMATSNISHDAAGPRAAISRIQYLMKLPPKIENTCWTQRRSDEARRFSCVWPAGGRGLCRQRRGMPGWRE